MFVHLEAKNLSLHMNVDECYTYTKRYGFNQYYDLCKIQVYGFIEIIIFINGVKYLSLFDKGNCTLLIKDGEILKEKIE